MLNELIRRRGIALVVAVILMAPATAVHLWSARTAGEGEATAWWLDWSDSRAAAWGEWALDNEHEALSGWFAERFGIPTALAGEIYRIAEEEGIEPGLGFQLIRVESGFRRTAVSYAGAVGYTQVMPATARWFRPGTTRSQLFDTQTNLRTGFSYLRYLLDYYEGDVRLALTAYNRGPGTVDGLLRRGGDPENGYARLVLGT